MKRSKAKKIRVWVTYVVVGGMLGIFLFDIATVLLGNAYEKRYPVTDELFAGGGEAAGSPQARIHFLDTGNSDCVLLESRGRFALIDSGWGGDNPNAKAGRPGYERRVLEYLKRVAADRDGLVTLEFVLPTHYHYDHAGGFAHILADPAIRVKTVYLRPLTESNLFDYELQRWRVGEIRRGIADAAAARGFSVVENLPGEPFRFGAATLRFFNLDGHRNPRLKGENDHSVVTLVTVGGTKALLAGDMTRRLEKELASEIGRVDLLKLGHHGYSLSNSAAFLRETRPALAVVTNGLGQVYPDVRWKLTLVSRAPIYSTVRENGVVAAFREDGSIQLTGNLHEGASD